MKLRLPSLFTALTVLLLSLSVSPSYAMEAVSIGKVTHVLNTVQITRGGNDQAVMLNLNDEIHIGDMITTADDKSFVRIDFVDDTHITLNGEDGLLQIDEYVFDPSKLENNKAAFRILRASFEFVGGLLDQSKDDNVRINLDFGSIGVRGTKILRAMKDEECWIYLEEGKITVSNGGGTVELNPGDGTRMKDQNIAPTDVKPWSQEKIDWIKSEVALPSE